MTHTTAPPDEPYEESADYSWTEHAFEMLESDDLHGEVICREGIVRSRVWGPCPRCGHALDDRQTHTAVTSLMGSQRHDPRAADPAQPGTADTAPAYFQVDVSCGCATIHPGAPQSQAGCGVSFRLELPLQPAGSGGQP
jgi:hypothetical protein